MTVWVLSHKLRIHGICHKFPRMKFVRESPQLGKSPQVVASRLVQNRTPGQTCPPDLMGKDGLQAHVPTCNAATIGARLRKSSAGNMFACPVHRMSRGDTRTRTRARTRARTSACGNASAKTQPNIVHVLDGRVSKEGSATIFRWCLRRMSTLCSQRASLACHRQQLNGVRGAR